MSDMLRYNGELSRFASGTLGGKWRVSLKTGTSYGLRDAWAAAWTPDYTVVVWAGNPDGDSWPGLVGARAAAPVAVKILRMVSPKSGWYEKPDEVVFNLLMGEIAKDNTTRKIIQFFVEKLIKDKPSAQKLFSAKLDEIEKAGLQSISYSTLELILKYYVCEERLNDYVERTYKLLFRNAAELFTNRRYDSHV